MRIHQSQLTRFLDQSIVIAVFMFPIVFLTIRSAIHVFHFGLLLITFIIFFRNKNTYFQFKKKEDLIIFATFSGLLLAVLVSQVFHQKIHMAAFDGPSRILFSGFIFLMLINRNISYISILTVAIPLGLICVLLEVELNPLTHISWNGRYATYFVDPNTLGSQTLILGILSLLSIDFLRDKGKFKMLLKLAGGLAGIYISIQSSSRGAWLVAPFILFTALIVRVGDVFSAQGKLKTKMLMQTAVFSLLALLIFIAINSLSNTFSARIISGYYEIQDWLIGKNLNSAGIRLGIWHFSFQFAAESFLFGHGEEKNMMLILQNSPLNTAANEIIINTMAATGPHSDILSKLLSSGVIGLSAYLALIFVPFYFFWKHRNAVLVDKKKAARIGMYYIVGVFIAGLSNEQLSLKYLCTFYGLMIATLLAQVLYQLTPKSTLDKVDRSKSSA